MLRTLWSRARFEWAERAFRSGDFARARTRYEAIAAAGRLAPRVRLKLDWIRSHELGFTPAWPRYPGATFQTPDPIRSPGNGPIRVADPRHPIELGNCLGLHRWTPGPGPAPPPEGPLVVWFNFKHSLGGELLAARLVHLLRERHDAPLVIACHERLVDLLRLAFPDEQVVSVGDDLRPVVTEGHAYVLARDLLYLLVKSPSDLIGAARHCIDLAPVGQHGSARARRVEQTLRIALSWKTTNRDQGRYRNPPLDALGRWIARHPNVEWCIAQHGQVEADLAKLRRIAPQARWHLDAVSPSADLHTLGGQIACLDGVVTIDNTLLHLAGSIGVPTLALISVPAYWAWPPQGHDSIWYESVRMIRQRRAGDWRAVWAELDQELAVWTSRLGSGSATAVRSRRNSAIISTSEA